MDVRRRCSVIWQSSGTAPFARLEFVMLGEASCSAMTFESVVPLIQWCQFEPVSYVELRLAPRQGLEACFAMWEADRDAGELCDEGWCDSGEPFDRWPTRFFAHEPYDILSALGI